MTNVFSGTNYNKAIASSYCPIRFQKEWKDGTVIKEMVFSKTVIDTNHSNDPIQAQINGYKVEIKISQIKNNEKKKLPHGAIKSVFNTVKQNGYFKNGKNVAIENFDSQKVVLEKEKGPKTSKTFEYNSIDNDFVPVVHLEDKVSITDGIPDFKELKSYCANLFADEILKEIRPDLYVTKSK